MSEDLLRQRRNLLSISFVLLLFITGGGNIEALFGVSFSNNMPIIFAWVGFIYFWWRYSIFGGNGALTIFRDECVQQVTANKKVYNYILELLDSNNLIDEKEELLEIKRIFYSGTTWNVNCTLKIIETNRNISRDINVDKFGKRIIRKNWVYTAIHNKSFSEFLLPHIFASFVLFIGAYHISPCILIPFLQYIALPIINLF